MTVMEPDLDECYFHWRFNCQAKTEKLIQAGAVRITNIIRCSKIYGDEKHFELENALHKDSEFTLKCHKSCASSYTSKTHTDRHKRQSCGESDTSYIPHKITRRSFSGNAAEPFSFRKHCLFCGEACNIERDKKHPSRWRAAYQFREIDTKQSIIESCNKRNDEVAKIVKHRVEGVLSDLHAADARYHLDCRQRFASSRSLPGEAATSSQDSQNTDEDHPLQSVVQMLKTDRAQMWNSVELFEAYTEFGGVKLSRRTLISNLQEIFGNDLLVLSSPGIANIIAFRTCASQTLRLVNDEEDDTETITAKASQRILQDVKNIDIDKEHYNIRISKDHVKGSVSEFLLMLLAKVSPKLNNTLPALLIGSIVTGIVKSQATSLQLGLAGKMGESKKIINSLYSYDICSSYTEYRRFKKSAAQAAVADLKLSGISSAADGLVQGIVDNFDADISSQNGRQSTHSLAILLTQYSKTQLEEEEAANPRIKRVPKDSQEVPYDVDIHRYQGPQQPPMPPSDALKTVPTLKSLAHQSVVVRRASEVDHNFFQDIITKESCPEFHGYNTKQNREQGHLPQPRTKALYLPLIDMKPSDPDTMLTAMVRVHELTLQTGQKFSLLTCDQQLYLVAVQVSWNQPQKFRDVLASWGYACIDEFCWGYRFTYDGKWAL